ncbi:hypothetical protein [Mucilaginibacter polytrichastri]|uniref:Uncharacterized protein n=1 Tax=Mucilaginibacter polytrichastri TaxID=1302689 RepID=A0A1Q5ZV96_9SPHI|nr:hypothetical protein [Mucilaginibacter polytrichastri]OKS85697.1 hypothetical protein RG47T_1143 [Mucilaginibacter polytrichastri]SFS61973.1 hypothetical protein SAMN04487890_102432 [Mucilaginibacter polytrichastri]
MDTQQNEPLQAGPAANNYDYPLRGLELLADTFLSGQVGEKKANNIKGFEQQLDEEISSLQLLLKTQAFALGREKEIRMLVQRYHLSLTQLLDETLYKSEQQGCRTKIVEGLCNTYIMALEKMVAFINDYFPEHHSPEQRVPLVSLCRQRKELVARLGKVEQKILYHPEEMAAGVLFKRLYRFAASGMPIPFKVRYRDVRYKEELLRRLDEVRWGIEPEALFTPVEQLLIYLNYNSKAFIKLLIRKIMQKISNIEGAEEKRDTLLLYQKAFRHIQPKPGMVLNPNYHSLGKVLNDWFSEEIAYLEKKPNLPAGPLQELPGNSVPESKNTRVLQKVLVKLSSDQAGLILRAADDLRILVARSLSEVFKTIVPHLSTPHSENLSYKGMRTQSYVAEERDKAIAIETLERIIRKIREY